MSDLTVPSRQKAVTYMQRTRDYYRAFGYTKDYEWAHNENAPLVRPVKPLSELRIGVVTTSSPAGTTRQSVAQVWSDDSSTDPESLFTDNLAWDKETTHTRDVQTFLPLAALREMVRVGEIAELASRYYGVPSEYSQRQTIEQDAPEILRLAREDGVDAMLLVPL